MKPLINRARARSIAGLVMFAGLAPFLLALMACLKVPVGNPEKSRVDPALSGVWQGNPIALQDTGSAALWIIEPWDARTWLVTVLEAKYDDVEDNESGSRDSEDAAAVTTTSTSDVITRLESNGPESSQEFKAWIATFSGVRFLVLEPKRVVRDEEGMKPDLWSVFRVKQPKADRMELSQVVGERIDEAETTAKAEAILRQHARDPDLYVEETDRTVLLRIPATEYGRVQHMLEELRLNSTD